MVPDRRCTYTPADLRCNWPVVWLTVTASEALASSALGRESKPPSNSIFSAAVWMQVLLLLLIKFKNTPCVSLCFKSGFKNRCNGTFGGWYDSWTFSLQFGEPSRRLEKVIWIMRLARIRLWMLSDSVSEWFHYFQFCSNRVGVLDSRCHLPRYYL